MKFERGEGMKKDISPQPSRNNSNDIIIRFVNCLADFVYKIKPFIVNILNKCECHFNNGTTIVLDKSELDRVKDLSVINSVSSSDFFTSINSAEQLIKQIKMSHSNCPLCPFNNSGDNTNKNKCIKTYKQSKSSLSQ